MMRMAGLVEILVILRDVLTVLNMLNFLQDAWRQVAWTKIGTRGFKIIKGVRGAQE
jgi:hypothetical protein